MKWRRVAFGDVKSASVCLNCACLTREEFCLTCGCPCFLTLEGYFKAHVETYRAELTDEIQANARELLKRVNILLAQILIQLPQFTILQTSGWRPSAYNRKIGGSSKSNHIIGKAVDIGDSEGVLAQLLATNQQYLVDNDLAMEAPAATPGWVHLQSVLPRSGKRVFLP